MSISGEKIRQHGTDACRKRAVKGAEQPARKQHEAVAGVHIPVHGGGDLNDHGGNAAECGKKCRHHEPLHARIGIAHENDLLPLIFPLRHCHDTQKLIL